MKNKTIIDGFDPSTFELINHESVGNRKQVRKWMNKGYVLPPGRPFKNYKEMNSVAELIRKVDPMLELICMLSFHFAKHPVYEIANATKCEEQKLIVGGQDKKFPSSIIELNNLQWCFIEQYLNLVPEGTKVLVLNPKEDIWKELQTRWNNISYRLSHTLSEDHHISIGSFFYTKLHNIVKVDMDVYDVAKLIGFGNVRILDLLLISTGIHIPWSNIKKDFSPPNPFEEGAVD